MRREKFDVVRAKRLELVDRADRLRAAVGPGPDGEVAMQFYDGAGQTKLEMSVGDDGRADLSPRDGTGRETAMILEDGVPYVVMYDGKGNRVWEQNGEPSS